MSQLIRVSVFLCAVALSSALQLPFAVDGSCVDLECSTEAGRATLWPFRDPNFFIRCEPPQWHLIRRPCLNGTLFHFALQKCVDPSQWEDPCPTQPLLPQCPQVVCQTVLDQRRLWPDVELSYFLQCVPRPDGGMVAIRRECRIGFLFSYTLQLCVDARLWEQDCTFDYESTSSSTPDEGLESTTTTAEMTTTTTTEQATTTTDQPTTTTDQVMTTTEQTTTTSEQTTTTMEQTTTTPEQTTTTPEQTTTTPEQTTSTPEQTTSTPEQTTTTSSTSTTITPSTTTTTTTPETTTTSTTTLAPGPGTTTDPIRGICPVPVCIFQDPNLYPHTDWTLFYQCAPTEFGQWMPVVLECVPRTYFHAGLQICVNLWEWEDFCV